MTTENIEIKVSSSGTQTVKREIEDIGHSAEGTESLIEGLKQALEFAGLAAGIHELVEAMDEFTNLQNKLKSVGTASEDLGQVWSRLMDISRQTYNSIETTATMYSRLELSLKSLGYSQNDVLDLTRELSAAMTMSGSSGQEAKYGLMDLVHGMSAGTITGRELRGVLQDLPKVAETLAAGLSKVQGKLITIGELRGMTEGHKKISTDMIAQAFKAEDVDLMRQMAEYAPTISNALTVLQTQWTNFVGQMATSSGIARGLAQAILFLADNFDVLSKAIEAIGITMLVLKGLPLVIGAVTTALKGLTLAALANPFTALVTVVTLAAAALYSFRDSIKLGIDDATTLGDLMRAAWEQVVPALVALKNELLGVRQNIASAFDGGSVMDWVNAAAKGTDQVVAYIGAGVTVMRDAFASFGTNVEQVFVAMVQRVLDAIGAMVNGTAHLLNNLPGLAIPDIHPQLVLPQDLKDRFAQSNQHNLDDLLAAKAAVDRANAGQGPLATGVRNILPRAQELGAERIKAGQGDAGHLAARGERHAAPDESEGRAREKLAKDLEHLQDKFDGTAKAVDEYNRALQTVQKAEAAGLLSKAGGDKLMGQVKSGIADEVLDKYDAPRKAAADWNREQATLQGTLKAGIITQQEYANALAVGAAKTKDAIDPIGAIYRALDRQAASLKLVGDAQRVESQYQTEAHALLSKGIIDRKSVV